MKTLFRALLLMALAAASAQAHEDHPEGQEGHEHPEPYVAGTHYQELADPVRTADPDKIEVTEIFWYGCPHCYAFEPLIEDWESDLSPDVAFVRLPAVWNQAMETHAQIYYAAEALDLLGAIHGETFAEIHQRNNYLQTEAQARDLFMDASASGDDFDRVWNSFAVTSAVRRAASRTRDYGVRGVPSMVVNGKYRIATGNAVSQTEMLKVVEFLVERERGG